MQLDVGNGRKEIDVKKYAKVEKVPGGTIEECRVLKGVMFNKDVVVSGKTSSQITWFQDWLCGTGRMRRKIENPRVLLLDCPLEYKKMENQANVEMQKEEDW